MYELALLMHFSQVVALYSASKRVSTIADSDNLFLFQVPTLLHDRQDLT